MLLPLLDIVFTLEFLLCSMARYFVSSLSREIISSITLSISFLFSSLTNVLVRNQDKLADCHNKQVASMQ